MREHKNRFENYIRRTHWQDIVDIDAFVNVEPYLKRVFSAIAIRGTEIFLYHNMHYTWRTASFFGLTYLLDKTPPNSPIAPFENSLKFKSLNIRKFTNFYCIACLPTVKFKDASIHISTQMLSYMQEANLRILFSEEFD